MVTKSLTLQVEIKDLVEQNILEIASCIWSFNKGRGDLAFQWRKEGLFNKKELEKLVVYLEKKNESGSHPYTIPKINSRWIRDLNVRSKL